MKKNQIKLGVIAVMLTIAFGSMYHTQALPPFLKKAKKFGARDCRFCHTSAKGGEGWNERGQWLMDEKKRRKAKSINIEWLQEYETNGNK
jgi:hypothetical protein